MKSAPPLKRRRVVIYLDEPTYRLIRAKLALMGKSFSQWVREMIAAFLAK